MTTGYPQDFNTYNQAGYPQQQQQQGYPQQNYPQFDPNAYNPNAYNPNAYNPNPYDPNIQQPQYIPPVQNVGYIPPQVTGVPSLVIASIQNDGGFKQRRLAEIDIRLQNDFSCYVCWIYFVAILNMIDVILDIVNIGNASGYGSLQAIYVFDMLLALYLAFTYFQGILALKNRDFEKNQLFKTLLLIGALINVGTLIWFVSQFCGEVDCGSVAATDMIGLAILFLVYFTADKVGKLLKERSDLLKM